ncbi:T-complex protein 1 subunit gamma Short=TCP-1-gamma [Rhizoctonia solani AG-1 IB]|uniref:CCT-gamma n=1 Tax=Thanatephorus cucumeris (strain AG1-IB / isolate 7/3/14) TaxID=1108050 RepID=M5CBS7_THACB|nr:T-complex protein 1 subunit gamma Short=TCP-1-gamma [Rhizoctonia solani AG-1 IB]
MFYIEKMGDEYFTFLTKCTSPEACTILLREPSKDILNEIDRDLADALEVIPRTLVQNAGGNAIRVLTELRAKHAAGEHTWGIDGHVGKITDMKTYGLYESASVKIQTLKTAIEATRVLLRVDDIVQATRKDKSGGGGGGGGAPVVQDMGQAADGEGVEPKVP